MSRLTMPNPSTISRFSALGRSLLDEGFISNSTLGANVLDKNEALRWAAQHGFSELVEALIGAKADVGSRDEDGDTAIHLVAMFRPQGAEEILNILAKAGPGLVDAKDNYGCTALYCLAYRGDLKGMEVLRSLGANPLVRIDSGATLLHAAAEGGRCDIIRLLVNKWNVKTDCRMNDGRYALHIACRAGHLEAVQLLVELGSDVNWKDDLGGVLHSAAQGDHPLIIRYLIEQGADINATSDAGWTVLHQAVRGNAASTVQLLLGPEYEIDIDRQSQDGSTALMIASINGYISIAKLLLEGQANINAKTVHGNGPLLLACSSNHVETIQYLFEKGASLEAKNNLGYTPLLEAIRTGHLPSVCLLLELKADFKATMITGFGVLHLASHSGSVAILRQLLDLDMGLETKTSDGWTPLMIAVANGNYEATMLLIERGFDIEARRQDSMTALHLAVERGFTEIVEALLDKGANPAAETNDGRNAQFLARRNGHDALAKVLGERTMQQSMSQSIANFVDDASRGNLARVTRSLDKGVGINAQDINGQTALSAAAQNGQDLVVALLITRSADLMIQGDNGESPLWWASRNGHAGVVAQLLSALKNETLVDLPDCTGQTPLSAASQQGHTEIVGLLLDNGADPSLETSYGTSSYEFASSRGHTEIMDLLLRKSDAIKDKSHFTRVASPFSYPETDPSPSSEQKEIDLAQAAGNGRVAEMIRLIKTGVDVDGRRTKGTWAPILAAAMAGQDLAIKTLLKYGASTETQNKAGQTALMLAAYKGHDSVIRLLCEAGCKINHHDNLGHTPLHFAARGGRETSVELLLELGCKKESKSRQGRTPLGVAAAAGQTAVAIVLLDHGANIEAADGNGRTPLLVAIYNGQRDMAELLLSRGAQSRPDSLHNFSPLCLAAKAGVESIIELLIQRKAKVNHLSDARNTPTILAATHGNAMAVKLLIEAGAEVSHRNDDGRTAMSYAKEQGHESIVKLLSQAKSIQLANNRALNQRQHEELIEKSYYQYRPLKAGHIRVLELQPGKKGDILSFEITEMALHRGPPFEALSYEWKEDRGTIPVQCNQDWTIDVTPNCKAALERLRLESSPRSLWIDAVCINQANPTERNEQVALMTEIFRTATTVLMWLGEETGLTQAAFDTLDALSLLHGRLEKFLDDSWNLFPSQGDDHISNIANSFLKNSAAVQGMAELYHMTYFTRAWIFQEIILSDSRGLVLCGSYYCPWDKVRGALVAYQALAKSEPNRSFHEIVRASHLFHKDGALSLEIAVFRMTVLNAKDPRDKIFAAIRLSKAPIASCIQPPRIDYNLTTREVYVGAVRYFIDSRSSDGAMWVWNLSSRHSTKTITDLPTWVPDLTVSPYMGITFCPFPEPKPVLRSFIQGRLTTTTSTSLHIDGSIIGTVVLSKSIVKETEVYEIVKSIVQTLADLGRGIFDEFPDYFHGHEEDINRFSIDRFYEGSYGHAICRTLFWNWGHNSKDDEDISAYLAWKLSIDCETPELSRPPPGYSISATDAWCEPGKERDGHALDRCGCNLDICHKMEDRVRYNSDFVVTEEGHFGLTNKGEAKKGMIVALVKGSDDLSLLNPREANGGEEQWSEYVDRIFMLHVTDKMKTLEDLKANATVERFEIR